MFKSVVLLLLNIALTCSANKKSSISSNTKETFVSLDNGKVPLSPTSSSAYTINVAIGTPRKRK